LLGSLAVAIGATLLCTTAMPADTPAAAPK
jgi:hypothetical protein